jgi:inner membrane protease subunit 2
MLSPLGTLRTKVQPYYPLALSILMGTSAVITSNDHLIEPIRVTGISMIPSLSPNYHSTGQRDTLLLDKWAPTKHLHRGDVVVLKLPHKPDGIGIKRVVALEGDWVTLDWRRSDVQEEGKKGMVWEAIGEAREVGVGKRTRVRIPVGHVWVEGDNAQNSRDSNFYGPVSVFGICLFAAAAAAAADEELHVISGFKVIDCWKGYCLHLPF